MLWPRERRPGIDINNMKVIRTFAAISIARDIRSRISDVQEQAKKLAPDVKWVAPELLHVTLKFLGNVREDELARVFLAVDEAAAGHSPFDLSFSGMGSFGSRVVWVGIEQGRDELRALAKSVEDSLAQVGFPREERAFKAHITIGRVRENGRLPREFSDGIEEINASDLGSQRVESIVVMQSDLQRDGPVYSPMSESKLT